MERLEATAHHTAPPGALPSAPAVPPAPPPPHALEADVTFPQLLMDAIERETTRPNGAVTTARERVFAWLPAGNAFVVRDKAAFEREVLPKYFNKCKFSSFVRKLYRWGFHQDQKSTLVVKIFRSKHFVRGDKRRCLQMRSIVRTLPKYPSHPPSFAGCVTVHRGRPPPAFEGILHSQPQYGITTGPGHATAGNTVVMATAPHPFSPRAPPPRLPMGTEDVLHSSRMLQGGRPFPALHVPNHQYSRSGMDMGMTSPDTLDVTTRVEILLDQRRRSRRQLQLLDLLHARPSRPPAPPGPPTAAALHTNYAASDCERDMSELALACAIMKRANLSLETRQEQRRRQLQLVAMLHMRSAGPRPPPAPLPAVALRTNGATVEYERDMSEVELACEIMKRVNPAMEPRRALALAKRHLHPLTTPCDY